MKILFFGDSITDMGRNRTAPVGDIMSYGCNYVFDVATYLQSAFPNKYEIICKGISGNRSVDLYARIKADVWNYEPDVVSILIGVNEVWHELEFKNGVELDRFEKVYRMMIEDTQKYLPDTKIMLLEPFYLNGSAVERLGGCERFSAVRDYAGVVCRLAGDYGLPLVKLQDAFDEKAAKYGEKNYLYDGVHPNLAGAKLIADEWLKVYFENVEKN